MINNAFDKETISKITNISIEKNYKDKRNFVIF